MHLAQGQLNVLATCPRQFQYIYLDQLRSPETPEAQARQDWGSRFHLLMQQHEMGLPIGSFTQVDRQLQQCFTAFIAAAEAVLISKPLIKPQFRQSEHCRTCHLDDPLGRLEEGYGFTVIYDLLILDEEQAQILDWKTYSRPEDSRKLAKNWQTRLYLYVLAETSSYEPEQISMTYWFVQPQPTTTPEIQDLETASQLVRPQSLKFSYSAALHQQTYQDLMYLLSQLTTWLEQYQAGNPFPQALKPCDLCYFTPRCDRHDQQQSGISLRSQLPDFEDIQEVAL